MTEEERPLTYVYMVWPEDRGTPAWLGEDLREKEAQLGLRIEGGAVTAGPGIDPGVVFSYFVYAAAGISVVEAAVKVARFLRWVADKGWEVRVDESGIDVLARGELARRGHGEVTHISVVQRTDRDEYVATYGLAGGRLVVFRYRLDSVLLRYDEIEASAVEDRAVPGFDPNA